MGKKSLKTRSQFTSTLRNDLYAELQQASQNSDIPISRILDRALEKHLEEFDSTSKSLDRYKKE
jgi:hypothetical protein